MATTCGLKVSPHVLYFLPPLDRKITNVLTLSNCNESNYLAFKIKTTKPTRYFVKPNSGVIGPGEKIEILVQYTFLRDPVKDAKTEMDKFLVASIILNSSPGLNLNIAELFNAQNNSKICTEKLLVRFTNVTTKAVEPLTQSKSQENQGSILTRITGLFNSNNKNLEGNIRDSDSSVSHPGQNTSQRNEGGLKNSDEALRLSPKDANDYINQGLNYFYCGQFDAALNDFAQAIKLKPDYAVPYVHRGRLYEIQGETSQSQKEFQNAITCTASDYNEYTYRGIAHMKTGKLPESLNDLNQALKLNPTYLIALVNRGHVHSQQNVLKDAQADWQTARQSRASSVQEYFWRAQAKLSLQLFDEAISDFDQALNMLSFHPEALAQRGFAHYQLGNYQQAHLDWNHSLRLVSSFPIAKDYLKKYPLPQSTSSPVIQTPSSSQLTEIIFTSGPPIVGVTNSQQTDDLKSSIQKIPPDQIILDDQPFASGQFGFVFQGQWHGSLVACKQLKDIITDAALKEFNREAAILAKLNSPYIVRFYGISTIQNFRTLVMEYCGGGTLLSALRSEKEISWEMRYQWGQKIAFGLSYLHSNKIIHNDLAARNILLDKDSNPKISDFGLSKTKLYYYQSTSDNKQVPLAWTAPERLNLTVKQPNEKCDIYSFGVVLWEIASRDIPLKDLVHLPGVIQLDYITEKNYRDDIPQDTPADFAQLIRDCEHADPQHRPSAEDAAKRLTQMCSPQLPESTQQTSTQQTSTNTSSDTSSGTYTQLVLK